MNGAKRGHGNVWMLEYGNESAAMNTDFFVINTVAKNVLGELDFAYA